MSSQPEEEIIHIIFTMDDVESMAEMLGIDVGLAKERAESWASAIEDTANNLINEQLCSVIEYDCP